MSDVTTVLRGGTLLTLNASLDVLDDAAIGIAGDRIAWVAPGAAQPEVPPEATVIDMSGRLLLPGLVNTHTHLPMSLFRGLADDLPLKEWLEKHIFPAEAKFINPESVRVGTRLSVAELLLGGTTTCADGYSHANVVLSVAREMGLRGVFAQGIVDAPAPGVPDPSLHFTVLRRHLESRALGGVQVPAVFAHAPYTCSRETLLRAKDLAREYDALFFIHVAEARWELDWCRREREGLTPVRYLHRLGLLDSRTVLVHAVHVDEAEADLIAASGAGISVNTESNMKLGSGVTPIANYLERGIPLGLGTDGCASNNDLDLFLEMSQTARLSKLASGDPVKVKAADLVQMATRGGAKVLGLDRDIGSIEPGKQADIIALRLNRPHAQPLYNPYSHLVYSASAADVDWVMVGGDILARDGKLLKADTASIRREAVEWAGKIRGEQG
ncbi:MAG: hypothetical protein A3K19_27460 [Lentisphaerae bacterium RIFOXYB12_FULL_65_16]|nr:MAG: hypothetical protein A3K18_06305 [Lentisphaerae bacterium RIFOXYA12_64_32]OGV86450.1 MAG: hypothetical protein A3K19_27460 [Lentisphaerae bacterium RIFOXYB12_FULL_65_16]